MTPTTTPRQPSDTVFVTFACAKDVHYAKALLGSIRHFYPEHEIRVVLDDDVPKTDAAQIERFPAVRIHRVGDLIHEHKINLKGLLAKLNVFFLPGVSSALVADADSILTGPVLEGVDLKCDLNSLNSGLMDLSDPAQSAVFNRWAIDVEALEARGSVQLPLQCKFVQGSHFYVNVERFPKNLIFQLLPDMGYAHTASHLLRAGDQGFWNYIANLSDGLGLLALQTPVTLQVGVSPHRIEFDAVSYLEQRVPKDIYFIHYVGFSRRYQRRHHEYATALKWGTRLYYDTFGHRTFLADEARRATRTLSRMMLGSVNRVPK